MCSYAYLKISKIQRWDLKVEMCLTNISDLLHDVQSLHGWHYEVRVIPLSGSRSGCCHECWCLAQGCLKLSGIHQKTQNWIMN